jgi:hypothetical protein
MFVGKWLIEILLVCSAFALLYACSSLNTLEKTFDESVKCDPLACDLDSKPECKDYCDQIKTDLLELEIPTPGNATMGPSGLLLIRN